MKTLKALPVTWNGQPMRMIYPHATRFQVFKFKAMKFLVKVVKITLVGIGGGLLIAFSFKIGQFFPATYKIASSPTVDNLPVKIHELKSSLLTTLNDCESPANTEHNKPVIIDTNHEVSIGAYRFQIATVVHYYKTLYNQTISPIQAILISLDKASSSKLASDIIFGVKGGLVNNWTNCTAKYSLDDKLTLINQLQN